MENSSSADGSEISHVSRLPPEVAALDPRLQELRNKYIHYAVTAERCKVMIRAKAPQADIEAFHEEAAREFRSNSDKYPRTEPMDDAGKVEYWRKVESICKDSPSEDPAQCFLQCFTCFGAMQFIRNYELDNSSASSTLLATCKDEISEALTGHPPRAYQRPPGALSHAHLFDWVGSSFQGPDAVKYYVEDAGSSISKGDFFVLVDEDGKRMDVSAYEFEQMVEGLDIPPPDNENE